MSMTTKTKNISKNTNFARQIPDDVVKIPTVPDEDYFSEVSGVYYHFTKGEWRLVFRDPGLENKRCQKTYSIRKYGFYLAKKHAEDLRFYLEQQYNWPRSARPLQKEDTKETTNLVRIFIGNQCNAKESQDFALNKCNLRRSTRKKKSSYNTIRDGYGIREFTAEDNDEASLLNAIDRSLNSENFVQGELLNYENIADVQSIGSSNYFEENCNLSTVNQNGEFDCDKAGNVNMKDDGNFKDNFLLESPSSFTPGSVSSPSAGQSPTAYSLFFNNGTKNKNIKVTKKKNRSNSKVENINDVYLNDFLSKNDKFRSYEDDEVGKMNGQSNGNVDKEVTCKNYDFPNIRDINDLSNISTKMNESDKSSVTDDLILPSPVASILHQYPYPSSNSANRYTDYTTLCESQNVSQSNDNDDNRRSSKRRKITKLKGNRADKVFVESAINEQLPLDISTGASTDTSLIVTLPCHRLILDLPILPMPNSFSSPYQDIGQLYSPEISCVHCCPTESRCNNYGACDADSSSPSSPTSIYYDSPSRWHTLPTDKCQLSSPTIKESIIEHQPDDNDCALNKSQHNRLDSCDENILSTVSRGAMTNSSNCQSCLDCTYMSTNSFSSAILAEIDSPGKHDHDNSMLCPLTISEYENKYYDNDDNNEGTNKMNDDIFLSFTGCLGNDNNYFSSLPLTFNTTKRLQIMEMLSPKFSPPFGYNSNVPSLSLSSHSDTFPSTFSSVTYLPINQLSSNSIMDSSNNCIQNRSSNSTTNVIIGTSSNYVGISGYDANDVQGSLLHIIGHDGPFIHHTASLLSSCLLSVTGMPVASDNPTIVSFSSTFSSCLSSSSGLPVVVSSFNSASSMCLSLGQSSVSSYLTGAPIISSIAPIPVNVPAYYPVLSLQQDKLGENMSIATNDGFIYQIPNNNVCLSNSTCGDAFANRSYPMTKHFVDLNPLTPLFSSSFSHKETSEPFSFVSNINNTSSAKGSMCCDRISNDDTSILDDILLSPSHLNILATDDATIFNNSNIGTYSSVHDSHSDDKETSQKTVYSTVIWNASPDFCYNSESNVILEGNNRLVETMVNSNAKCNSDVISQNDVGSSHIANFVYDNNWHFCMMNTDIKLKGDANNRNTEIKGDTKSPVSQISPIDQLINDNFNGFEQCGNNLYNKNSNLLIHYNSPSSIIYNDGDDGLERIDNTKIEEIMCKPESEGQVICSKTCTLDKRLNAEVPCDHMDPSFNSESIFAAPHLVSSMETLETVLKESIVDAFVYFNPNYLFS